MTKLQALAWAIQDEIAKERARIERIQDRDDSDYRALQQRDEALEFADEIVRKALKRAQRK